LASVLGIDAKVRYDAELNWPHSIHMRKKLDAYALLYLNGIFRLSKQTIMDSSAYKSIVSPPRGWVDIFRYNELDGLSVQGWAWDHALGAPKAIRVYKGNQIVFLGKTNYIRLDIEAGAKAGFDFRCHQNPVLKSIMANGGEFAVYATFDGLKWDELQIAPDAIQT